ncbi:acyltransferase [Aquabacterium sp.]|uniref:acyltransferase n=1 Tax=Aquabacterium sp. TaxID=1872578 RepID=UPI004037649B
MAKSRSTLVLEKRVRAGVTASPQYLSGLDMFHSHASFPLVLVYKRGLDLALLEKGLSEALKRYPLVAGRYKKDAQGQVYMDCNDAGVDFRVHRCEGKMPYSEANPLGKDIMKHVKVLMPWAMVGKDKPPLQVNVHQYEDKGVVLCCYATHSVFDGASFWNFMMDWSKACRGMVLEPHQALNRNVMIDAGKAQVDPASYDLLEKPPLFKLIGLFARLGWRAVKGIDSGLFRIPAETIQAWKDQSAAALPGSSGASTGSLVTAYIMKGISPALQPGVDRSVGLVMDLRYKRDLRLPRDYFGNALCYAEARYTPEQLAKESLPVLAEKCRAPAEQVNTASLQRMLSDMEAYRQRKANWRLLFKPTVETLKAGLILNNCVQFPIYDIDMGSGAPDWYEMCPATIRLLLIVPTPSKDGGVDLLLSASTAELKSLRAQFAADGIDTALKTRQKTPADLASVG